MADVCDDAVSIVTDTTRNSDEFGERMSPYESLLGLTMLESRRVLQMDNQDKRLLSPVLPVQTSMWPLKVDSNHTAVEESDHDSVMSESLLRHTEQKHAQQTNNPDPVSENQASQLLFDDTQSSGAHSEILPVQPLKPDCQSSADSGVSRVKYVCPNVYTQSHCLSRGDGDGTNKTPIEDVVDSSGGADSLQTKDCNPRITPSSGEIGSQLTKVFHSSITQSSGQSYSLKAHYFHPNSTQSSGEIGSQLTKAVHPSSTHISGEIGRQPVKAFHPSSSQSFRDVDGEPVNVSHTSSGDQTKGSHTNSTQNSVEIDGHRDKVSHASSTQSSGKDKRRRTKLGSSQEESMSGESPRKCKRFDTLILSDDEEKTQISSSQKGHASQSTISPRGISPEVTEHDREEMIFRKIVKQQDYVDKQLRKSGLLGDVDKVKQHMDTLQSLLRQLSDQHKSHRHRLTADVRVTSKTKQDRLRHKYEIEKLGKRQRQLIQLVQRQKTLTSKLKDIERTHDVTGNQTITASLSHNLHHGASQITGSSQMTVTPSDTKEPRMQDTQSSRSSARLTIGPCSQSLLLGYTNNGPVVENVEQNRAVMSLPTTSFLNNTLINIGSEERPGPGHEGTNTQHVLSANPSFEARSAPVKPNTLVEKRSAPVQPSTRVGSAPVQPSIRVEERSAPLQINPRVGVSNNAGRFQRICKLPTMSNAGLNTQPFNDNTTPSSASPYHTPIRQVQPNMSSKDTFSQAVINANIRILYAKNYAPVQGIKPTSGNSKPTFVPPPIAKPQPKSSTIISSSPPPSQRQMMPHDPLFKSPPMQNITAVDNISPSTASCSDVFPVKSKEITRRIQQRRLLAESQKGAVECEAPIPVLKPLSDPNTKPADKEQRTTTVSSQDATRDKQPCSTPVQKQYPPLATLIDRGALVPGKDCLVTESQHGRYIGSLTDSGLIRGPGGEVFKTPVQWVSAVNDGVLVKKGRAYREVFYHGQPLLTFINPGPSSLIDLTKIVDEPVSERVSENGVMEEDVIPKKQAPFDLETLLMNCTVRIISDSEIVTSSDLPENFWSEDFSTVRLPQTLQEQIDCW